MIENLPEPEINNTDRAEIARLIEQGFTSGKMNCENGKEIIWVYNPFNQSNYKLVKI